jgi:hypothetical protein
MRAWAEAQANTKSHDVQADDGEAKRKEWAVEKQEPTDVAHEGASWTWIVEWGYRAEARCAAPAWLMLRSCRTHEPLLRVGQVTRRH